MRGCTWVYVCECVHVATSTFMDYSQHSVTVRITSCRYFTVSVMKMIAIDFRGQDIIKRDFACG